MRDMRELRGMIVPSLLALALTACGGGDDSPAAAATPRGFQ